MVTGKKLFITEKCIFKIKLLLFLFLLFSSALIFSKTKNVKVGADVLFENHLNQLVNHRVGVICNQTSILSNGVHLVDSLLRAGINVTTLYSPEHGIRGNLPAGQKYEMDVDNKTGLPIYSLYGKSLKPDTANLANVDVVIFDLQDVGARFYTYSITMAYAMQAAAEQGKKFIILDRPNPINGIEVEGPILDTALKSGVGLFPIPIRHGLTLGEFGAMIVGEKWMNNLSNIDLKIVPMEGWRRDMYFDNTHLQWIAPSPNMKTISTAIVYPGTCLFEGTNVSEGRGTSKPFEFIGAPWINSKTLVVDLNMLKLSGVKFQAISFIPESKDSSQINLKYDHKSCNGVYLKINNRKKFKPVMVTIKIIQKLVELYADSFMINPKIFSRLIGVEKYNDLLTTHRKVQIQWENFHSDLENFIIKRQKYLIY
jgi:uncharacterized protein YbbC (DUF1343 family)